MEVHFPKMNGYFLIEFFPFFFEKLEVEFIKEKEIRGE